jgi:ribonuclease HI
MPRKSILEFFVEKESRPAIEHNYDFKVIIDKPREPAKNIEDMTVSERHESFLKQFGIKTKKPKIVRDSPVSFAINSDMPIMNDDGDNIDSSQFTSQFFSGTSIVEGEQYTSETGEQLSQPKKIVIYTDGSCIGNGRKDAKGGIGIYYPNGDFPNVSERFRNSPTNQRCELSAIYCAIRTCEEELKNGSTIMIYTDSEYSLKCLKEYCKKWSVNGWVKADKKPVENLDIIEPLYSLYTKYWRTIKMEHVRAHTGGMDEHSRNNDIVDNLARKAATS